MLESEKEMWRCWDQSGAITDFEDGREPWARECSQLLEAEKGKK